MIKKYLPSTTKKGNFMKKTARISTILSFCLLLGHTYNAYSFRFGPWIIDRAENIATLRSLSYQGLLNNENLHANHYIFAAVTLSLISAQNMYLQRNNIKKAYRSITRALKRKKNPRTEKNQTPVPNAPVEQTVTA